MNSILSGCQISSRLCRRICVPFLTTFVIVLFLVFLLTIKTDILISCPSSSSGHNNNETEYQSFGRMHLSLSKGRLDAAGIVKIYDWVWVGSRWEEIGESQTVCLATQASVDRLHWTPELEKHWNGRLSLAVYIVSPNQWMSLKRQLELIQRCKKEFGEGLSIHVVIPVGQVPAFKDQGDPGISVAEFDCSDVKLGLKSIVEEMKTPLDTQLLVDYPQNHLRNIATRGCGSEWVFSTDIDIIPFPNSASLLDSFLRSPTSKECSGCAFVIPTFELAESEPYPKTREELLSHWRSGKARPFHWTYYKQAHLATNYEKWRDFKMEDSRTDLQISHDTKSGKSEIRNYEPFYISPATIPPFPERFRGYGFTRSSQVQASLAEGWTFKVLTPIFGIHWGLQSRETVIDTGKRRNQTKMNGKLYSLFMEEMNLRSKLRPKETAILDDA